MGDRRDDQLVRAGRVAQLLQPVGDLARVGPVPAGISGDTSVVRKGDASFYSSLAA